MFCSVRNGSLLVFSFFRNQFGVRNGDFLHSTEHGLRRNIFASVVFSPLLCMFFRLSPGGPYSVLPKTLMNG